VLSTSERIQPTCPRSRAGDADGQLSVQPTLVDVSEKPTEQPKLLSRDQQRDAPMWLPVRNAMHERLVLRVLECGATSGCS